MIVPDVRGLPTSVALQHLQDAGLTGTVTLTNGKTGVQLSDGGIVTDQSVKPGTAVPANQPITLTVRPDGLG